MSTSKNSDHQVESFALRLWCAVRAGATSDIVDSAHLLAHTVVGGVASHGQRPAGVHTVVPIVFGLHRAINITRVRSTA